MNLATPAPDVEKMDIEPAQHSSATFAEPARPEETAEAEPAKRNEHEPSSSSSLPPGFMAMSYLEKQSKVSVETLRKQGVDFESRAAVCRGAPKKDILKLLLPIFFDQRDFVTFSEIARYVIIRGGCCFVFLESTDSTPLYAFSLSDLVAEQEDPDQPDKYSVTVNPVNDTNKPKSEFVTVLLKTKRKHKVAHQFTFDTAKQDKGVVKRFMDVVEHNSKMLDSNNVVVEASVVGEASTGKTEKKESAK